MAIYDLPGATFESMGEFMPPLDDAFVHHLPSQIEAARSLTEPRHELMAKLKTDETTLEIPLSSIESVESAEEAGTFLMRFKEEVVGHKGRTALVTGAAVLVCAASIHVAKSHKKSHK